MFDDVIKKLILTVGAWDRLGQKDKSLEEQFGVQLVQLQEITGTTQKGALEILLAEVGY